MISRANRYLTATLLIVSLLITMLCPEMAFAAEKDTNRETIRVGFFAMDGYHMIDEKGNRSGYGYDFLRLMARYIDVDYEYVGYDKSWGEMQDMLENGEIDLLTSARKTPEREAKFDFSRSIGSNECMMTVRNDNQSINEQDYSSYNGLKVGMIRDNSRNDDFARFAQEKGFTYTPVYFDMMEDMQKALKKGTVDALVSSSMRATDNERVVEKFAGEKIYAIVREGNTDLLRKVNYAIDQINAAEGDWKTELFNRYYDVAADRKLDFTEHEKKIIAKYSDKNNPLKVICDPTRKPYSFYEDGEMKGILPDYFRKVAEYCGFSYEFVDLKNRDEYVAAQKNIDNIDISIDMRTDGDSLIEDNHFGISAPYISVRLVKVIRRGFDGDIKSIATVEQGASGAIEDAYAPNARKIIFKNRQDAMQAVKDGKADAAFVYYYMAQEFINNDTSGTLFCVLLTDSVFQYQMVTAPHVDHALAGILTKAIYAMPEKTIEDVASKYTSYKASDMTLKLFVQLHPGGMLIFGLIMIILFAVLVFLVIKNRDQNDELNDSLDKITRINRILDKMSEEYVSVYYIDLDSGKYDMLKLTPDSNSSEMLNKKNAYKNFDEYKHHYAELYILEEQRAEFEEWFTCTNMKSLLDHRERAICHFKSLLNASGQKFFSASLLKLHTDEDKNVALLGFRYIDEIIEKEKEIQLRLEDALSEAKRQNEIVSAISKSYNSIYQIDLAKDTFEEITNDYKTHALTGYSGGATKSLHEVCDTLVMPEYRDMVRPFLEVSTLADRLRYEEHVSMDYQMCDGNWHRLRFIVKNRDLNGAPTQVLCTVRVISDTKRREEDLCFAVDSAKREAAMKTEFLANMSHDIRTPLNGINGMINLAEQYTDDLEMQNQIRAKAMESTKYLVSLVNDILDMSKLQSGELKGEDMTFDISDLLAKINQIYENKASEKDISFKIRWQADSLVHPWLVGNPVYLGRILSNIADNAVKFSESGSNITVWGYEEPCDDDRVFINMYCKDEGQGMSEEFVQHACDIFSQGNKSSRSTYEGTGLGLAIAKTLAERMGGNIELQSELGVGTTVHIRIPFGIGEDMSLVSSKSLDEISVKGMRALVVEDNELNMEIAKALLELNGLEVTCASDGQEALEIFEESTVGYFGVIYMDIMMPRMDGYEATRAIRALKRMDAGIIPIIAMSANAFAEDIINSKLAGMSMHIAKPVDEEKMIEALKQCMNDIHGMRLRDEL